MITILRFTVDHEIIELEFTLGKEPASIIRPKCCAENRGVILAIGLLNHLEKTNTVLQFFLLKYFSKAPIYSSIIRHSKIRNFASMPKSILLQL